MTLHPGDLIVKVGNCLITKIAIGDGSTWMDGVTGVDPETCDHLAHLLPYLKDRASSIARFFRDPLWAERVASPDVRAMVLGELADVGMALAQVTLLVENPPAMDRIAAEIQRELIEQDNKKLIDFPMSRLAAEPCPPPSGAPEDGAERGTA